MQINNINKSTEEDILKHFYNLNDTDRTKLLETCYSDLKEGNTDQEIFQSLLKMVWTSNHSLLKHLSREEQMMMFHNAGFEPPKVDIGFKIYRGFSLPKEYDVDDAMELEQGLSWTTNKSISLEFAQNRVTTFGSSRIPVDTSKYNCWVSSLEVVNKDFSQDQFVAKFDDREEDEIIFYDDGGNEGLYQGIELLS